ncbi:MAG TPA: response regulator transcription factor [Candidatus Acidoferrum sp.]|jgi:DNA-binding NarL/FixJ family response regulator|nr:response regulator transcription factor [Candidatus Acidoferrum sp.]HEV2305736.1 response regulator transcription factor [Candidatus Acidoferrales bacterium]
MPIQVLLADDHQIVRQSLKVLLEKEGLKIIGEASNGQEAVRIAESMHPDVAVLDVSMAVLNGIDAAKEIQKVSPQTKTIFLTVHDEDPYLLDALRVGAKGYVVKTHAAENLVQAIREASRGGVYLSPEVSRAVVQAYQNKTELSSEPLSPRERQVLQLIAEGKTTKEVAGVLNISVKTAETHRTRIMEKLDIHETAGLVRYAIRRGLVQA